MALIKRSEKGSPLTHNEVDGNWTQIINWLAGKAALNHTHSIANVTGLQAALDAKMLNSQRGVANGVASLGSDGKVPSSQLPNIAGGGMYFPHETLTGADIGKLVIWKDGKAQLPMFEPQQAAIVPEYSFELNLASFNGFTRQTAVVTFSTNPTEGEIIGIYTFKNNPISSTDSKIQGTLYDTISTLLITIVNNEGSGSVIRDSDYVITIFSKKEGRYGYFSFVDDVLSEYIDTSFCTVARTTTTAVDRLGNCLVPFLFLWRLGMFGESKYDAYMNFYTNTTAFTEEIVFKYNGGAGNFPATLDEVKDAIVEWILKDERIISAIWDDDILKIRTWSGVQLDIEIDAEDTDYWLDAISDGTKTIIGSTAVPAYCKYPILGLVKSVSTGQVEIYTDPICTFKSTHDEAVEWTSLMDLNRCFILDPDNVGYLKPLASIEINSLDTLFILASAGYVTALDKNIGADSTFIGAFSLDLFALQVLYLLFSSYDEGGE